MVKTLHIIEPTFDFSVINRTSVLLTSVDTLLDSDEYHTSLGDMSSADIIKISANFLIINFVDKKFDLSSDIYKETAILLNYLSWTKNVTNFVVAPPITFADLTDSRRPDKSTLWVFGCSHSHGIGLRSDEKRFGEIVAESLNLPLMLVSKPGSSLHWSTRNLVAANIKSDDVVIWQLTTPHRISQFNGTSITETILARANDRCLTEIFNDSQVFFNHINLLNFGVQYLRKIGVKFVIVSILPKIFHHQIRYIRHPYYYY